MIDFLTGLSLFATSWTQVYEASPATNANPKYGDDQLREIKEEVRQRADQEHVFFETASTGETIHRAGSARAYYQATAPTLRPDGVTALDTDDDGRLWINSTTNITSVWSGTAWVGGTPGESIINQNDSSSIYFQVFSTSWNMDTTASVSIATGLGTGYTILGVTASVHANDGTVYSLYSPETVSNGGSLSLSSAGQASLSRVESGDYDSAAFNAATAYVTIWYTV